MSRQSTAARRFPSGARPHATAADSRRWRRRAGGSGPTTALMIATDRSVAGSLSYTPCAAELTWSRDTSVRLRFCVNSRSAGGSDARNDVIPSRAACSKRARRDSPLTCSDGRARLETADHLQPVVGRLIETRWRAFGGPAACALRTGSSASGNVRSGASEITRCTPVNSGARHPDDRHERVVRPDGLADDGGIAAEAATPVLRADRRHRRRVRLVVVRQHRAAANRPHAE